MEARFQNWAQTLPDATFAASYPTWGNVLNVCRIRRLRRIRQVTPILPTTPQLHCFQHHKFIIRGDGGAVAENFLQFMEVIQVTVGNDIQLAVDFQAAAGMVEHLPRRRYRSAHVADETAGCRAQH